MQDVKGTRTRRVATFGGKAASSGARPGVGARVMATTFIASVALLPACPREGKADLSELMVCAPAAAPARCPAAIAAFPSNVNEIAWSVDSDAGTTGGELRASLHVVEPQGPRLLKESIHPLRSGRETVAARFQSAVLADGNYLVRARVSAGGKSDSTERAFVVGAGSGTSGGGAAPRGGARNAGSLKLSIEPAPATGPLAGWDRAIAGNPELRSMIDGVNTRVALPRDVPVVFRSVPGATNAWYDPSKPAVVFSYDFLPMLGEAVKAGLAPSERHLADRVTSQTVTFILMHEVGHALRHQLDLPITGQEEDVVDEFATISFIKSGLDPIVRAGAVTFLGFSRDKPKTMASYMGEHALGEQRFANILCLLHGSDPVKYAGLVGNEVLASRASKCKADFENRYRAWKTLFAPFGR